MLYAKKCIYNKKLLLLLARTITFKHVCTSRTHISLVRIKKKNIKAVDAKKNSRKIDNE